MKKKGEIIIKLKIIAQFFLCLIIFSFLVNISGASPVFAVMMDSKNYRLEIESSDPESLGGGPILDNSVAGLFQKSHPADANNYGQYFKLKIALFTIILALMAFLYIKIAKKKYTITRKNRRA